MATLGTLLAPDLLATQSCWRLRANVNGYSRSKGHRLTTQAGKGRSFRILKIVGARIEVMLLDDGYQCWIDQDAVIGNAEHRGPWQPTMLTTTEIEQRIPDVLAWSERVQQQPNNYLWGGTTEPDMDCSGLMQMAFASQKIWIPRDAYQQEQFCQPIAVTPGSFNLLRPGDLIFFGTNKRCNHVGLHLGNGRYRHSSGKEHGRNGIGIDSLHPQDTHPVACHYRAELRGAGRVLRCHDGQAWA
ncbi:C40 family peptidase [Synechococcus sp. AH-601-N23]|nr:C40 family peptidase [Synechococcus sp. AH-601-N23]